MGNGQNIIDKILSDADTDAKAIIDEANKEADERINTAKAKAEKETAKLMAIAEEDAKKASSKEISSAQMTAKKMILAAKQEVISEVIKEAKEKLLTLSATEYKVIIIGMLERANVDKKSEVILSQKDKDAFGQELSQRGYKVSDEVREIEGGFIVKNGDIEYNYSFESIISVEKEDIEQLTAQILF